MLQLKRSGIHRIASMFPSFSLMLCRPSTTSHSQKGPKAILEYLNKVKTLSSPLGAAGQPLSSSEFLVYLLARLGTEYDMLVTFVTTHVDPFSPQQIYSFVLNHESWLQHQTNTLLTGPSFAAHITTSKPTPTFNASNCGRGAKGFRGRHGGGR